MLMKDGEWRANLENTAFFFSLQASSCLYDSLSIWLDDIGEVTSHKFAMHTLHDLFWKMK